MKIPTDADLLRERAYHGAWINEIDRERVRRSNGEPARSHAQLADAVQERVLRMAMAKADAKTGAKR